MSNLMQYVAEKTARNISDLDFFKPGDQVAVTYNIVEGDKQRLQVFRGDVLQIKGAGVGRTFTVRKISNGVGVERIFPFNCPSLVEVKNLKKGRVRRARLYYLRDIVGKTRIQEKKFVKRLDASRKGTHRKYTWSWEEKVIK